MSNQNSEYVDRIIEEYGSSIAVPIKLLVDPRYCKEIDGKRLLHQDAILYGYLLQLAEKQKNKDEDGEFVEITGDEIELVIGVTNSRPSIMVKRLEEYGLIRKGVRKVGQCHKLYINRI